MEYQLTKVDAAPVPAAYVMTQKYTDLSVTTRAISALAGPRAFTLKGEAKAVAVVDGEFIPLKYAYRMPIWGIEAVSTKLGETSLNAATLGRSDNRSLT